jgi:ankyrin repeat protein
MLGQLEGAVERFTEMDEEPWLGILRALLEAGADPNQPIDGLPDGPGYLLHSASMLALVPAMRLLLHHGADPNLLVDGTDTALDWAVGDAIYTRLQLPEEYASDPLPEYPPPSDAEFDAQGLTFHLWMLSRHQRGIELLRHAGAKHWSELATGTPGS